MVHLPSGGRDRQTVFLVTKAELRTEIRQRVRTILDARIEKSRALLDLLVALPEYQAAKTVGIFAPMGSEPLVEALWERGAKKFCYPRVEGERLILLRVNDPAEVNETAWNPRIREPADRPERRVELSEVDFLLVPGVAFTAEGFRLGRGGGFYDRLLAGRTARTFTAGICWEVQMVPELPAEDHDLPVQAVVTDARLYRP